MSWLVSQTADGNSVEALRKMLSSGDTVVAPGTFNALVALAARRAGFTAGYFSGAAFSASLGLPDVGLFTLDELTTAVRWVVRASGLPLIVDGDTGFGEALNVARTIRELEAAGAAAVHLEDQEMPKRCGHLDGKTLVSPSSMVEKVRAAVAARQCLLVIARTDARGVEGLDAAVARARLYKEAGADVIFPEGLESEAEFLSFAQQVDGMLLANMTEFGKTPYISAERFRELGYQIVIFPVTTLRVAVHAVEGVLAEIKEKGTQAAWLDRMQTREELYDLIEYDRYGDLGRSVARDSG